MPFPGVLIFEEGFVRLSMLVSAAAVLALCSVEASAQFTGVVVPPKARVTPAADSTPKAVAKLRDSVAKVNLGNMKDWVDSAAATLGVPAAPAVTDSAAARAPVAPAPAARAQDPSIPAHGTTEFREGAAAPNTATPIPLLALTGLTSLAAGLWLLRRRRA
jgi:LPXTG-motif cell wall-anchored protein